jgi:hypothetical protein
MAFAPKLALSSEAQHKHIYFPDLVQPKDLLPLMQVKPKEKTIATDIPLITPSF